MGLHFLVLAVGNSDTDWPLITKEKQSGNRDMKGKVENEAGIVDDEVIQKKEKMWKKEPHFSGGRT